MSKKALILGLSIAFIIAVLKFSHTTELIQTPNENKVNPTQHPAQINNSKIYTSDDTTILVIQATPSQVKLISNLDANLTALEAREKYSCKFLTSAGFYTENHKPVGLFQTDNTVTETAKKNSTFNGFLSVDRKGKTNISPSNPPVDTVFTLQTGPLLIANFDALNLQIKNDKKARRIVAAIDSNNTLLLIAVYTRASAFSGPELTDLPFIIKKISDENTLNISDAINLDGGTASAYLSDNVVLNEASPVGSFLCVIN